MEKNLFLKCCFCGGQLNYIGENNFFFKFVCCACKKKSLMNKKKNDRYKTVV